MEEGSADALDLALTAAADGEPLQIEHFFRSLLGATITVPRRFQNMPLSDAPTYPNDLIDVLGVRDKERVVVPIFSRGELVREWAGTDFLLREMKFLDLVRLLPEEWWVCLNPRSEVEKELSPWELDQLKGGETSIAALVAEYGAGDSDEPLTFNPVPPEFTPLEEELRTFAATHPEIQALYLVARPPVEGQELPALVVAAKIDAMPPAQSDALRDDLRAAVERKVIGAATVQVLFGGALGDSMLDTVFHMFAPAYARSERRGMVRSLWARITAK